MTFALPPILHVYFRAPGARPLVMALSLFVAGIFDVLGMSLIIPLVASMSNDGSGTPTRLGAIGKLLLEQLHIPHDLGLILLCMAAMLSLKSALILVAMRVVSHSVAQVGFNLRQRLLDAVMRANLDFFAVKHPGRIANTLVNDVTHAAGAYNQSALAVTEGLKIASILTIAALISGWLLLAALFAAAVTTQVLEMIVQVRKRAWQSQHEVSDELRHKTQDTLAGIKALKGMERVAPVRRQIETSIEHLRRVVLSSQTTRYSLNATQDIFLALALCGGLYVSIAWIHIGAGELIVLATLFVFMTNSLRLLQGILHSFREMLPGFAACEAMQANAEAHAEHNLGRMPATFTRAITFEDVHFAYGKKTVLDGVSFEIAAGSIAVLEGESGAGKTTTIDLIAGFHQPGSGRILLDGVPLSEVSMSQWRTKIGYVPQDLVLVEGSIHDNITLGAEEIGRDAVLEALELAGLGSFIRSLPEGVDSPVGVVGAKLSGGQRQRISLARALVFRPTLLILDEVTSALDFETERQICASLEKLSPPTTIIAITHRPAWTAIADRVLRFDDHGVSVHDPAPRAASEGSPGEVTIL